MNDPIDWTEGFKQAVRDAIDIADLAKDLTRLEERGGRWVGLCPFHEEKTPSFSVDPEKGLYYCHGCGAGGDAIKFHMETTGEDFKEAMESLAGRYGIPIPRRNPKSKAEIDLARALTEAQKFFVREMGRSRLATTYLEQREITTDLIETYGVGFAPDEWQQLTEELQKNVPLEALIGSGLVGRSKKSGRPYDRFRNRLMFPIHDPGGRLVGFGGRTLGDDKAKYVNTSETVAFRKKHLLYGFHRARPEARKAGQIVLVEGYFDVLGAVASGVTNVVASMGTALTGQQVGLLERLAPVVVIGYDGDRAGNEACRKVLGPLLARGLVVRRARFPAGQDPDSLRLEEGPEAVREAVTEAPDALELEIDQLPADVANDPPRAAAAALEVRQLLRPVRDDVLRYGWTRRAAERLGLPEDVLRKSVEQVDDGSEGRPAMSDSRVRRRPRMEAEIVSLEEGVLLQFLRLDEAGLEHPPTELLPPAGAFLKEGWRKLYEVYLDLRQSQPARDLGYAEELNRRSQERRAGGPDIDLTARLLRESSTHLNESQLRRDLGELSARFRKRRRQELARAMAEAQREGDQDRLDHLVEEITALRRPLPPSEDSGVESQGEG